jgi:hypothetical protein
MFFAFLHFSDCTQSVAKRDPLASLRAGFRIAACLFTEFGLKMLQAKK